MKRCILQIQKAFFHISLHDGNFFHNQHSKQCLINAFKKAKSIRIVLQKSLEAFLDMLLHVFIFAQEKQQGKKWKIFRWQKLHENRMKHKNKNVEQYASLEEALNQNSACFEFNHDCRKKPCVCREGICKMLKFSFGFGMVF